MAYLNSIHLIGHVGADLEIKTLAQDKKVVSFSLATSKKVGEKEFTQWHTIEAWNAQAENMSKFLKKGSLVHIEGELHYDSFEKDGVKRSVAKVAALSFNALNGLKEI